MSLIKNQLWIFNNINHLKMELITNRKITKDQYHKLKSYGFGYTKYRKYYFKTYCNTPNGIDLAKLDTRRLREALEGCLEIICYKLIKQKGDK